MKYELFDGNGNIIQSREYTKEEKQAVLLLELSERDKDMPRLIEDIIDVLTPEQKEKISSITLDKYQEKKTLRDNYNKFKL
jgi:hypothetical protein